MSGLEFLGFVHDRAGVVVTVAEPDDTVDLPVAGVGAFHSGIGTACGSGACAGAKGTDAKGTGSPRGF